MASAQRRLCTLQQQVRDSRAAGPVLEGDATHSLFRHVPGMHDDRMFRLDALERAAKQGRTGRE